MIKKRKNYLQLIQDHVTRYLANIHARMVPCLIVYSIIMFQGPVIIEVNEPVFLSLMTNFTPVLLQQS